MTHSLLRRLTAAGAALILLAALGGCQQQPAVDSSAPATTAPTTTTTAPAPKLGLNRLTGEADMATDNDRPIGFVVTDETSTLVQLGLESADFFFEAETEGGIPRILAVYSSAEKMDWSLVEAARDLGASPAQAFFTVTLKLTMPGLLSGVILTFIPSMGLFFIADILGGNKVVLVGSLIQDQLLQAHNWPFAAALSVVLMLLTSLMIGLYKRVTHTTRLEGLL